MGKDMVRDLGIARERYSFSCPSDACASSLCPMRRRRVLFALLVASVAALAMSCGSRTGLLVDVPVDAGAPEDAYVHGFDVALPEEDAGEGAALPPLDGTPPPAVSDSPD